MAVESLGQMLSRSARFGIEPVAPVEYGLGWTVAVQGEPGLAAKPPATAPAPVDGVCHHIWVSPIERLANLFMVVVLVLVVVR